MATREKKGKGNKDDKKGKKMEETPVPAEEKKEEEILPESAQSLIEEAPVEEPIQREQTPEPVYDEPTLTELIVESYEGEKEKGLYAGEGTAYFTGGHMYQGNFAEGMMSGKGIYTWADGVTYEGEFLQNKVSGIGKYTWPDKSTYEGEVVDGLRHGQGTFHCKDGAMSYTGEWCYGKRHGKGRMDYDPESRSFYDGDWVNNIRHGWGTRQFASGNVYDGMWFSNMRHGEGTMKWLDRNQMYVGTWEDGIQHGMGQHIWFLRRIPGSQYPLRNMYDGEFDHGLRNGRGTFYYANGSSYQGMWTNNMKHGKGKFTFKNGRIYEGAFEKDHILEFPNFTMDGASTPDITAIRTRTPLPQENMSIHSNMSSNTLTPSFQLEIDHLLHEFTEIDQEEECQQVMCVILRHMTSLKTIYNFYSVLGYEDSPDNTFIMSRMQFWRFMKDCHFHHYDTSLSQLDRELAVSKTETNIHNPYDRILLREFLNHLVTLAYHIYREDHEGTSPLLAWCLSKLVSDNILPFACKVQGYFYYETRRSTNALVHLDQAYLVFQGVCKNRKKPPYEPGFKMRDFLHLMKSYNLINEDLSPKAVIDVLARDDLSVADDEGACNLELDMTFLEFFEALVGCAEKYVTEAVVKDPGPNTPHPSTVYTHEHSVLCDSPVSQSRVMSQMANPDADNQDSPPNLGAPSDVDTPTQRPLSSADMTNRTHKTDGADSLVKPTEVNLQASMASHVTGSLSEEAEVEGPESVKVDQSEVADKNKSTSYASSHTPGSEDGQPLLQSVTSMAQHSDIGEEAYEEVQHYVEELDESTRSYNFWTHQVHIFFVKKLFPAAEKLALLTRRIVEKNS